MKVEELIEALTESLRERGNGEVGVQHELGETFDLIEVNTETGDVWLIVDDTGNRTV